MTIRDNPRCVNCAKNHEGSIDVSSRGCEGCLVRGAMFAMPPSDKVRWCAACAKQHPGAIDIVHAQCEDCLAGSGGAFLPRSSPTDLSHRAPHTTATRFSPLEKCCG